MTGKIWHPLAKPVATGLLQLRDRKLSVANGHSVTGNFCSFRSHGTICRITLTLLQVVPMLLGKLVK